MTDEEKEEIKRTIEFSVIYHDSSNELTVKQARELIETIQRHVLYRIERILDKKEG